MGHFGRRTDVRKTSPDQGADGSKDLALDPQTLDFFTAVYSQNHQHVKEIIKEKRVNISTRDIRQHSEPTALLIACELNDKDLVKLLLQAKPNPADVNAENNNGRRPIW